MKIAPKDQPDFPEILKQLKAMGTTNPHSRQAQIKSPAANAANLEFDLSQRYQKLEETAKNGSQQIALVAPKIASDQLSFSYFIKPGEVVTRHQFTGTVKGDTVEGMVKIGDGATQQLLPWSGKVTQRVAGPQ